MLGLAMALDTTTRLENSEPVAWRELDLVAAEAELRLRMPDLQTALEGLDKAKIVTQETLECEFSI